VEHCKIESDAFNNFYAFLGILANLSWDVMLIHKHFAFLCNMVCWIFQFVEPMYKFLLAGFVAFDDATPIQLFLWHAPCGFISLIVCVLSKTPALSCVLECVWTSGETLSDIVRIAGTWRMRFAFLHGLGYFLLFLGEAAGKKWLTNFQNAWNRSICVAPGYRRLAGVAPPSATATIGNEHTVKVCPLIAEINAALPLPITPYAGKIDVRFIFAYFEKHCTVKGDKPKMDHIDAALTAGNITCDKDSRKYYMDYQLYQLKIRTPYISPAKKAKK
jgi:hypothetical protein